MATPAPRTVLSSMNARAASNSQDSTAAYATPAPAKVPMATPMTRATSAGKWSAIALAKTPADESALLRQLSSVVKEHLDTVTKAAKSSPERAAAEAAAAAELERLHAELAMENYPGSEEKPTCIWPENTSLRMSLWSMVSELSDMISLPAAAEVKSSLQSWAEGGMLATVAVANMAVAGIQQRLLEAAGPEGYEASELSSHEHTADETCDDAASTPALALPAPNAAAVAPKQAKRRKPLLLRLLFAGVLAAGAAAAAVEARKQLELRAAKPTPAPAPAPAPEAAAEPEAAPAASA